MEGADMTDEETMLVTIDVPEDWTPWAIIRAGRANGRGWTARIPRSVWDEWMNVEPRWRAVQNFVRHAQGTVDPSSRGNDDHG